MNINGIQSAAGATPVEPLGAAKTASSASGPTAVNDVVEISTAAKLAAKINDIPDVRADLVAQVKAEIAAGTYDTPERIDAAVNKLMDELLTGL